MCCIAADGDCWPTQSAERLRCCFEEYPLSREHRVVLAGRAGLGTQCHGSWDELRKSLILNSPVGEAFRWARQAVKYGPCLLGELCLAVLDLLLRAQLRSLSPSLLGEADLPAVRLLAAALPPWWRLARFLGGELGTASSGWPLLPYLLLLREHVAQVAQPQLEAVPCRGSHQPLASVRAQLLAAAKAALESAARPALAKLAAPLLRHLAAAGLGRGAPTPPQCALQAASAALATAVRHRRGARESPTKRRQLRGALAALAAAVRRPRGFWQMLSTPWPVLELLGRAAKQEPVVLHPTRLLGYYRLDSEALADVPWPRSLRMQLLDNDGVSLAIQATGLPFCGGPLWLRWVATLWQGGYRGPLRTIEGGAEVGSCSLWAAAMLERGSVDLQAIGVEPIPAAAMAFRRSARANGWAGVKVVQAALVNQTMLSATGRGGPYVELKVAPGRLAEASAVACAAGRSCHVVRARALRLDDLPLPPLGKGKGGFAVVHCLKLNVMGFELEALQGGATRLLQSPGAVAEGAGTNGVGDQALRPLVCSVILDELKLDRGAEDMRRFVAIVRLLRERGFRVEAFVRDHGAAAAAAPHRVLVERVKFGQLSRLAARALHALPADSRQVVGFVLAGWREVGAGGGACRATEPPFRPEFSPEDFGEVLPA